MEEVSTSQVVLSEALQWRLPRKWQQWVKTVAGNGQWGGVSKGMELTLGWSVTDKATYGPKEGQE